ncbi:GNAT family N-acetyltransferase [Deefgea salmonis]|uniref:GNAT family N-acetyltransferase n=1 Tax=Deefgea salmonis TaxID=2875502 RepID=A0ABS8BJP3_9NEIS|nr:GNAT family N-acetyltransferase [Deefgea salmonis]MCB5195943.1 GNAT family N-acetyltransferase [Deefgea salmonis]
MLVELISENQYESLIDLLLELHCYYSESSTPYRSVVREHLLKNILAPVSPLQLVVAINGDGVVVGFAAISLTYSLVEPSPEKNRQVQLKEIYVLSAQRGHGIGKAIFAWIARYAMDNGCCRIDWPVKSTNAKGISFYESLGAELVVERLSYRLSETSLRELAYKL